VARAKFYYAYTLQGWLKSINPDIYTGGGYTLRPDSLGHVVAASAYNLLLNYHDGDYSPISGVNGPDNGVNTTLGADYRPLFNDNRAKRRKPSYCEGF